ncbi:MAG: TolC family protein [Halanaerobiaceae bacterium]
MQFEIKVKVDNIITFFVIFCFFVTLNGCSALAEEVSLHQLLEAGYRNNFSLKESRLEREMAEVDQTIARRAIYPEVSLNSSYTKLDQGQEIFNPEELTNFPHIDEDNLMVEGPDEVYNTGLSLQQPIYMSGKLGTGIDIAGKGLELARAREEMTAEEVLLEIIQAYFNVLMAREQVEIEEQALETVREHKKTVEATFEAGMALKTDLLQVEIEEGNTLHSLQNARDQLQLARRTLFNLTGMDLEEKSLKEVQLSSSVFSQYNIDMIGRKKAKIENEVLPQIYSTALKERQDLKLLDLNKELTELNLNLEEKANLPDIFLNASYNWQGDQFTLDNGSWELTLGLSMNLFDGGKSQLEREKLRKELNKIDSNQRNIRNMVEVELEKNMFDIEQNHKNIQLQELNLVKARENLNLEEKRYRAGMGNYLDVMNARTMLKKARTSLGFARYNYQLSMFDLLQKTGLLMEYFEGIDKDGK